MPKRPLHQRRCLDVQTPPLLEPFQSGFDLMPEHFSLLAGLSPLGLYNAHWRMKETTPLVWVLKEGAKESSI